MNANIVLSVKNRKVFFNPHADKYKWTIVLPIERIEVKCDNSHYIENIGYIPKDKISVRVLSDNWTLPKCEKVVLPLINSTILMYQLANELFDTCHTLVTVPTLKIEHYIKSLRGEML